jgi:Sigma-70 factor, region 1.1
MQWNEIIRKAVELGRLHGFVTFDQLDALLPSDMTAAPENIEAVMEALSDEGINVVEGD